MGAINRREWWRSMGPCLIGLRGTSLRFCFFTSPISSWTSLYTYLSSWRCGIRIFLRSCSFTSLSSSCRRGIDVVSGWQRLWLWVHDIRIPQHLFWERSWYQRLDVIFVLGHQYWWSSPGVSLLLVLYPVLVFGLSALTGLGLYWSHVSYQSCVLSVLCFVLYISQAAMCPPQ